jgi:hypothetical protein
MSPPLTPARQIVEDTVLAVVSEIEAYLREHPDSADTAEHIVLWWLKPGRGAAALPSTRAALQQLEAAGFVERIAGDVYRRRR